jgi:hypothetical protein
MARCETAATEPESAWNRSSSASTWSRCRSHRRDQQAPPRSPTRRPGRGERGLRPGQRQLDLPGHGQDAAIAVRRDLPGSGETCGAHQQQGPLGVDDGGRHGAMCVPFIQVESSNQMPVGQARALRGDRRCGCRRFRPGLAPTTRSFRRCPSNGWDMPASIFALAGLAAVLRCATGHRTGSGKCAMRSDTEHSSTRCATSRTECDGVPRRHGPRRASSWRQPRRPSQTVAATRLPR